MKHFLLTRFNDYYPGITADDATTKNPNIGIEDDWLRSRIDILNNLTAISVLCQSDQDFTWIIKCHPHTPVWARKKLSGPYINSYDEIEHYPTVDLQASHTFTRLIRKITPDKEILTTRLDSDDGVSKDFIALIKKYTQPNLFFDFSKGIVKNEWGIHVQHKPKTSQFCSYLEYRRDILTVYHRFHTTIESHECLKNQVDFGWLQYNHTTNNSISKHTDNMRDFHDKVYPYKATTADWDTLKLHYPYIHREWFKFHPKVL